MQRIALVTLICLSVLSCGRKKVAVTHQPEAVNTQVVEAAIVDYTNEYPGVVNALVEVNIISQVTGAVTDIYFTDGQKVKKGQKLYSIDKQQFKAQYDQAVANLNAAKANLDKAQKDADRYNFLQEKDAIAKQTVDYAQATLETAKQQVKAAEEGVVNQSAYLRYSEIASPADGNIGFSAVKKGALVTAGNTVLNTISSNNPIGIDFYLNEKEVPTFMAEVDKSNKDSLFTVVLPDNSVYSSYATIYAIDRAIDPQTATLKVRLLLPNEREMLKAGMSCTVRMKVSSATKLVTIPAKALVEQMGEYFVYVVQPDSTVREQRVSKGRSLGVNVTIDAGLAEGETIVVDGIQSLRPGAKVMLRP